MSCRLAIIDDDHSLGRSLQLQLGARGYEVRLAHDEASGLALVADWRPRLVLLDLRLGTGDGLAVLARLQGVAQGEPAVILITGQQDSRATVESARLGAQGYLRKPFGLKELLATLERCLAAQSQPADEGRVLPLPDELPGPREIVGSDPRILELLRQVGQLARTRVTVLLEGESGTGKEAFARALHEASGGQAPFVAVNCSAIVATLLESELFGHERGAFTGAEQRKPGRLELAGEGTIFLDEIGDLSLDLQAKLLRVLQEREFQRVGGVTALPLRARVVAATHRSLAMMVAAGEFRQDLYYRLAVSVLRVPPLRERRTDLPALTLALLARLRRELGRELDGLTESALARLSAYDWPGNVRELENVLTRALALAPGKVLRASDLQLALGDGGETAPAVVAAPGTLAEAERQHLGRTLTALNWNISQAAAQLDISPTTLRKKISDFGLRRED